MSWRRKLLAVIIYVVVGFFSGAVSDDSASKVYAPTIPPQANPFYADLTA